MRSLHEAVSVFLSVDKSGMNADTTPDSSSGVASDEHYHTSETSESSAAVSPFQESLHQAPRHHLQQQQQQQHPLRADRPRLRTSHHPASATAAAAMRYLQSTPSSDLSGSQTSTTYVRRRMPSDVETTNNGSRQFQEPRRNQRREEEDDDNDILRKQTAHSNCHHDVIIHKTNVSGQRSLNGHSPHFPPSHFDHLQRLTPSALAPPSAPPPLSATKNARLSPSSSYFGRIPDEVMMHIFSYLCSRDLCRCAMVCHRWYKVVWNPVLWTAITINDPLIDVDRALKCLTKILSYDTPVVCITVEEINLSCCERLTDKGLYLIASRFPELRRLQLDGCVDITNIVLFEVVSRCVNLEHLSVAGKKY